MTPAPPALQAPPAPRAEAGAASRAGGLRPAATPPPFAIPASHFAVALVCLALAGPGLAIVAPELSAGALLSPRVVAVTHLLTLGWITTTILGAAYQLVPVALGRSIAWPRAAWVTLGLHVPGLALLVGGLLGGRRSVLVAGALLLAAGLFLFAANLGVSLTRAPRGGLARRCLGAAAVFLVIAVVLGMALGGNLGWGYLGGRRLLALTLHVHVALLGWVLLVIVGVSQRLLPMFLLSHGVSERPAEWSFRLLVAGLGVAVLGHHGGVWPWGGAAVALCAAGVAAWLLQLGLHVGRRRRPLDPGMTLVVVGGLGMALALGIALPALRGGLGTPRWATSYGVALVVAGFTPYVAGHLYRILPFLTWFHRHARRLGRERTPTVGELVTTPVAWVAVSGLGAGALALVVTLAAGAPVAAVRGAALLFTAGALTQALQLAVLVARGRA
jgi:hypothetical protein